MWCNVGDSVCLSIYFDSWSRSYNLYACFIEPANITSKSESSSIYTDNFIVILT